MCYSADAVANRRDLLARVHKSKRVERYEEEVDAPVDVDGLIKRGG